MDTEKENLISLISELNRSCLKLPESDVPPTLLRRLNKKMINSIFRFAKKYEEIPTASLEDLHSRTRKRILALLPAHDYCIDDARRLEIHNGLSALEELFNDDDNDSNNNEELAAVLSCLYTLSKITVPKKRHSHNISYSFVNQILNEKVETAQQRQERRNPAPSFFDFQNLDKLYVNSSRFNDINWKLFKSSENKESKQVETNENVVQYPCKLYANSPLFNDINWNLFNILDTDDCSRPCHSAGLYLDSPCFNDINWNLFKINTDIDRNKKKKNLNLTLTSSEDYCSRNPESFNDLFKYKVWNFDIHRPVEPLMPDEGFITPGSNFSEELSEHADNSDSEILLTSASASIIESEVGQAERFVWEHPHNPCLNKESNFVSEYPECVLHIWKIWNASRKSITHPAHLGLSVSFDEFKIDINHLLFGVASNCFYFAPITGTFHVRENLHMHDVTPELLVNFCQSFLECGNNFVALRNFAETKSKVTECGPVYRKLCSCILNSLQMHRYCLLNIKWDRIHLLTQLEAICSTFRGKLSFAKDLCVTQLEHQDRDIKLARGVLWLDHLYDNLVKVEATDFKFLLLYFFEGCCNVYLKIVSEWIFHGCFSSPANYNEFFIQIQHELEVCWDWRRLSYVRMNERYVPKFLKKFFKDIFACGKSVNLLRIFTKKEIFERILPNTYPTICCCFNSTQIETYALEWKHFQDHFYKKRNWNVKLKDKLAEHHSGDFHKIKKARQKKLGNYERNDLEEKVRSASESGNIEEKNTTEEVAVVETSEKSSPSDQPEEIITSLPHINESIVENKIDPSFDEDTFHTVSERGDGPSDTNASRTPAVSVAGAECSDYANPNLRTRLTVTSSPSVFRGAGDSTTVSRDTSFVVTEQSEYERNRQKSANSDFQNQLNMTSEIQSTVHRQQYTSTPLNICAQNRLKNMSTTFNDSPAEPNICETTPMTDCLRNRIKVMRSEYYERLSMPGTLDVEEAIIGKARHTNESEKNKLKVMSSEYHIRLNALADQENVINNKLMNRSTMNKLTEREVNKQKVMSEEYRQPLKVHRSLDNTLEDLVPDLEKTISPTKETETICESDREERSSSENLVTIIENIETPTENEESIVPAIHLTEKESAFDVARYSSQLNVFKRPVTKLSSQLLTEAQSVKDVDFSSVLYYLSPSISIPLQIQSKLVNEAILWVFIEQEGYLEHLKALRNFVLLRKPEFAWSLTNSLFEMCDDAKKPSLLLNTYTLNSILQRAFAACNSRNAIKFERYVSFVLENEVPPSFNPTDIQMLRCLSMRYAVKWPVNVLITEPILKKYTRVFRFLIQFERVSWALKTNFRESKNLKVGKSVQYRLIHLYRRNMTQIIRLLNRYIMLEALEQCWNDLVNHLTNIEIDLDELYMSHLRYVNKIIQRCFLCEESKSCHKAILNVFESVLQYHDALRKGSWRLREDCNLLYHTNFQPIPPIFQQFGANVFNFRAVLKTLVYKKQKTYFEPLLQELDRYQYADLSLCVESKFIPPS